MRTTRNPKVDRYLEKAERWQEEMALWRRIILEGKLTEELKWGKPFYTHQGANVLVIWGFKDHCALGFCKGALLKDARKVLSNIGEHTQAARKIRFTSARAVLKMESVLSAYIQEAVEVERAGGQVIYKKTSDFEVPAELTSALKVDSAFQAAFDALTPGRQRGYLLHFAAPKQSKTRAARVGKYRSRILVGKGIHDPESARREP